MSKHLFFGEETYTLWQALKTWKAWFLEKFTEQGLFEFTSENIDIDTIKNAILSQGMFTSKKLVIIHWIPRDTISSYKLPASKAEPIETWLTDNRERIPEETVLLLVTRKPDKRRKWWKFFNKHVDDTKEFKTPRKPALKKFVTQQTDNLISWNQAGMVVDLVWKNMHNLAHEAEKLTLFAQYNKLKTLTDKQIADIVYHQWTIDAFWLLDTLFSNKTETIQRLQDMQEDNHNEFQTMWMLYYGLKTILSMIDCDKRGITNPKAIAKEIKAPPFAVAKQMKSLKNYRNNDAAISHFYRTVLFIDFSIKSGRLPIEWFRWALKKSVYELPLE